MNHQHLDFYYKCMETGYLPEIEGGGLCNCAYNEKLISEEDLNLFIPSNIDFKNLSDDNSSLIYWGYEFPYLEDDNPIEDYNRQYKFTPLRQTIVLLIAAIKDEL